MNRRGFLRSLAGLVGATAIDPNGLWEAPRRVIYSFPRILRPSRNQLITPEVFAHMVLVDLREALVVRHVFDFQGGYNVSVGDTVNVRRPRRFVA